MVQVNRVCLKILFINRPQFLVDSNADNPTINNHIIQITTMKKILLLLIAALTMTIASAKDIKTVVLTTVPQMHCENCEKRIKDNIRFEKGIKKIVTDVEQQTVTITYDADKTTVENIIKGFEKIKYNAREVKDGEQIVTNEDEECPNM